MSETKRPSATAKPTVQKMAASNKGPTATGLGEIDYNQVIGARCQVTTSSTPSITLEGTIFTICPITNILAISTSSIANTTGSKAADYKLIPISRIQSFTLYPKTTKPSSPATPSATSVFENAQPIVGRIDLKVLQAREAAAIKKIKEKDASRGKGVSKEGQDIFDALLRTLPTRWDGQNIIVNDLVSISPPYTPDNCKAAAGQHFALDRVKIVLEAVRRKLGSTPSAIPAIPSKSDAKVPVASSRAAVPNPIATPLPRKGG